MIVINLKTKKSYGMIGNAHDYFDVEKDYDKKLKRRIFKWKNQRFIVLSDNCFFKGRYKKKTKINTKKGKTQVYVNVE